jgi:formylmethanofuran dehydrogenase subunit B
MSENIRTVKNAVCTFCGCVCDDMELTVDLDEHRITKAKKACIIGRSWFTEHVVEDRPIATVGGKEVSFEEAVEESAQILTKAKFPIIYGLSETTCEAQQQAVAIADYMRGSIDSTSSVCHGPTGMGYQTVGESTTTLGEVKNRADLVMFWGCNPAEAHPRLFTRYAVTARGMFTPQGKKDRTVVLVDPRKTASAPVANIHIRPKLATDFEILWALRALIKGKKVNASIEEVTGVPMETLVDLADRMKNCNFGVVFFGMGLTMGRGRHYNTGALFSLVTDLNEFTHFVVKPARGHGNVTGADHVLTWQTGYPFGVNFNLGYPRFNPGEFTAVDSLARDGADAAMIIASDPGSNFPKAAVDQMKRIPVISLDTRKSVTSELAHVVFATSTWGINTAGTAYRMDDIPITLRPAFESPYPSDETILKAIKKRVFELTIDKRGISAGSGIGKAALHAPL